jgi:hypothetical protein|tara:strand:- start:5699 stop:6361 length:663 start_codon:yes stop_codon:yes gene_type:complete
MIFILVSDAEEMDIPIMQALEKQEKRAFLVGQEKFLESVEELFSHYANEPIQVIWGVENIKVKDYFESPHMLASSQALHRRTTTFFEQIQKLMNLALYHACAVSIWTLSYDYTMNMLLDAPCNPISGLSRANLIKCISRESGRRKLAANHIYLQPSHSDKHKADLKHQKVRASLWKKGLKLLSKEELAASVVGVFIHTPSTLSGNVFEISGSGTNIGVRV